METAHGCGAVSAVIRWRCETGNAASSSSSSAGEAGRNKQGEEKTMIRDKRLRYGLAVLAASAVLMCAVVTAQAADKKPNILIIWGDDIGYWNVSAYNQGMMGYKTPNIDRIAKEGALFTDWYGQQSCTAGRSCFITGQSPLPHRPAQGRPAGREGRACRRGTSPSPSCSRRRAT